MGVNPFKKNFVKDKQELLADMWRDKIYLAKKNAKLKVELDNSNSTIVGLQSDLSASQAAHDALKVEHDAIKVNRQAVIDDILSNEQAIRDFFGDWDNKNAAELKAFLKPVLKALLKIAVSIA